MKGRNLQTSRFRPSRRRVTPAFASPDRHSKIAARRATNSAIKSSTIRYGLYSVARNHFEVSPDIFSAKDNAATRFRQKYSKEHSTIRLQAETTPMPAVTAQSMRSRHSARNAP